jgi:hypothetical protein
MTNLLRLSIVMLGLGGMLGAAACSACMPQTPDTKTDTSNLGATSYTCGSYTHLVGTQCVADNPKK